jgi:hypothetical protein
MIWHIHFIEEFSRSSFDALDTNSGWVMETPMYRSNCHTFHCISSKNKNKQTFGKCKGFTINILETIDRATYLYPFHNHISRKSAQWHYTGIVTPWAEIQNILPLHIWYHSKRTVAFFCGSTFILFKFHRYLNKQRHFLTFPYLHSLWNSTDVGSTEKGTRTSWEGGDLIGCY